MRAQARSGSLENERDDADRLFEEGLRDGGIVRGDCADTPQAVYPSGPEVAFPCGKPT